MAVSNVELIVNAVKAINPLRQVDKEGRKVQRTMSGTQRAMRNLSVAAGRMGKQVRAAFDRAAKGAKALRDKLGGLGGAILSIGAGALTKRIIGQAAEFKQTEVRLKALSEEYGEFGRIQQLVSQNAKTFNQSQAESASNFSDVYARLRPLGISLDQIQTVYEGFNATALASGTSAAAASGAFLQLSQALGSGRLQGDEFRSIAEQVPGILRLVSKEMNVTVGELKELGSEGKITSDILINALAKGFDENKGKIDALLAESPAQQFQAFNNAVSGLSNAIGSELLPVVVPVVKQLTELVKVFGDLPGPIKTITAAVIGITGAVVTIAPIIATVSGLITTLVGSVGLLSAAIVAIPIGIALVAFGNLIKRLVETKTAQDRVTEAVNSGSVETIKSAIAIEEETLSVERNKAAKMSLLGINSKLLQSQKRLRELRAALAEAEKKPPEEKKPPTPTVVKPDQEELKRLALIAQKSAEKVRSLEQQKLLASALTEEERREFERQIQIAELLENKRDLTEAQLRAELEATLALHEQEDATRAIIEANEQRAKSEQDAADAEKKRLDALQKAREADPGYQMQQELEELLKLENQVAAGATAIGNAFANSFKGLVTGAKTGQEALADMMSSVAEHFMDMATQIIAKQLAMIAYGTIMKALGVGGGGFETAPLGEGFSTGAQQSSFDASGLFKFADGGYVNKPTNALIGEGSEPEYVIPESKMRESMARYSRGSRGAGVIPDNGGNSSEEGGAVATAAPIDVRFSVERINSVDYVTADQFQAGMQQAATQGAKQGEQQTLRRLKMSGSTRKRIGM